MARISLLAALVPLAACSDAGVQAINADPTAQITSHADGDEPMEGFTVAVQGGAHDLGCVTD